VQARQLVDAGADALVCHHTHTLQTIETYRGRSIYYSIGNFIFDQTAPLNKRACLVKITVEHDKINVETIPTGMSASRNPCLALSYRQAGVSSI
jgi:poly-gamma-glutamate synthesis protein (capsule biosynthesis protein)